MTRAYQSAAEPPHQDWSGHDSTVVCNKSPVPLLNPGHRSKSPNWPEGAIPGLNVVWTFTISVCGCPIALGEFVPGDEVPTALPIDQPEPRPHVEAEAIEARVIVKTNDWVSRRSILVVLKIKVIKRGVSGVSEGRTDDSSSVRLSGLYAFATSHNRQLSPLHPANLTPRLSTQKLECSD